MNPFDAIASGLVTVAVSSSSILLAPVMIIADVFTGLLGPVFRMF